MMQSARQKNNEIYTLLMYRTWKENIYKRDWIILNIYCVIITMSHFQLKWYGMSMIKSLRNIKEKRLHI